MASTTWSCVDLEDGARESADGNNAPVVTEISVSVWEQADIYQKEKLDISSKDENGGLMDEQKSNKS